jgi:hypothetical protein
MMTDEMLQDIKRRIGPHNQYESWYKIFNILFPDAPRPISPYVTTSDPVVLQHFVELFRGYGPEEFFGLLRDLRERSTRPIEIKASTQAIVDEAFEIALPGCLERLAQTNPMHEEVEGIVTPPSSQGEDLRFSELANPMMTTKPVDDNAEVFNVEDFSGFDNGDWEFDPVEVDRAFDFYGQLCDANITPE